MRYGFRRDVNYVIRENYDSPVKSPCFNTVYRSHRRNSVKRPRIVRRSASLVNEDRSAKNRKKIFIVNLCCKLQTRMERTCDPTYPGMVNGVAACYINYGIFFYSREYCARVSAFEKSLRYYIPFVTRLKRKLSYRERKSFGLPRRIYVCVS